MSEQALDVRSTLGILRRHKRALAAAGVIGAVAGIGLVLARPPLYTSESLLLLPPSQDANGQPIGQSAATEARIAASSAVLEPAGRSVKPRISAHDLSEQVTTSAPTTDVLRIRVSAPTARRAEDLARAVARAEVAYSRETASSIDNARHAALKARAATLKRSLAAVNAEIRKTKARTDSESGATTQGEADATALAQLTAQQGSLVLQLDQIHDQQASDQSGAAVSMLQDASSATRPSGPERYALAAVVGIIGALGLASLLFVLFGRRDRRLRYRDEIADALGGVVVASVRSRTQSTVAGWTGLLEGYTPGTVDAWALRQALRHLLGSDAATGSLVAGDRQQPPVSVTVVALSDDLRGLAIGPQLASYAASAGVTTRLVVTQGHESSAALWAACSGAHAGTVMRDDLTVDSHMVEHEEAVLTVCLAVLDRRNPQLAGLPETDSTLLCVASGAATAEDLARAAVTADDAGRRIEAIIVADPDDLDRTTGRMLQAERSQQVPLPAHLTGVPGAEPRGAGVSGLRNWGGR